MMAISFFILSNLPAFTFSGVLAYSIADFSRSFKFIGAVASPVSCNACLYPLS